MTKQPSKIEQFKNHWLYKKYIEIIEPIEFNNASEFWNKISTIGNFPLQDKNNSEETVFNWDKISPHYSISFNYENSEPVIMKQLMKSKLINKKFIMIDFQYSEPILKIKPIDFITNWMPIVDANCGLGSVLCSDDFEFLVEFTNDHTYEIKSNFFIA